MMSLASNVQTDSYDEEEGPVEYVSGPRMEPFFASFK